MCSVKKVFLKILQISQGNTCARVSFILKKRLWHRCFPGNFVKFLRTAFSTEHLRWLLLDLITAYSFDICFKHLGNLGFVVHPEKSVFVHSQEIEYLGFIINSITMKIRLTTEKKRKIFDLCQEVLLKESISIRLFSKLLGKFTSSFQVIKYGQLNLIKAIKAILTKRLYYIQELETPHLPLITTDASTTAWGAAFKNTFTGGQFSITETVMHINVLELKAILFGLRSLCDHICDSHIKIIYENTTAVHCINNMGSCRSVD